MEKRGIICVGYILILNFINNHKQPNKYAEFLLPKQPIDRLTKFIVEEEGWYLVELDKSSVPGIMYLSATEDKINFINDDLENEIGDADKLAKYDFIFPEKEESLKIGEQINLTFSIAKDGIPISIPCIVSFKDRKIVKSIYRNGEWYEYYSNQVGSYL